MPGPLATASLESWVEECARLAQPDRVAWCEGTGEEYDRLVDGMVRDGTLERLNPEACPGCLLHRSQPSEGARTVTNCC